MTLELVLSSASLGLIAALAGVLWRFAYQQGRLQVQVETMWEFFVRRAKVEMHKEGWGELRSPIRVTVKGMEAVMPFLDKFLPFYSGLVARRATETEMFFEFERVFGDFILEKICLPTGIAMGACLLAIIQTCEIHHKRDLTNAEGT